MKKRNSWPIYDGYTATFEYDDFERWLSDGLSRHEEVTDEIEKDCLEAFIYISEAEGRKMTQSYEELKGLIGTWAKTWNELAKGETNMNENFESLEDLAEWLNDENYDGDNDNDNDFDFSSFPTFGGKDIRDTAEVWSWDAENILTHDGNGSWNIEPRCKCGEASFNCDCDENEIIDLSDVAD